MIGATVDITERKLGELELARAAAIVMHSQDAIVGKDLKGIITAGIAGPSVFGYSAGEIIGKPLLFLYRANDQTKKKRSSPGFERGVC